MVKDCRKMQVIYLNEIGLDISFLYLSLKLQITVFVICRAFKFLKRTLVKIFHQQSCMNTCNFMACTIA